MGGMGLTRRRAASQEASPEAIEQAQELAQAGEQCCKPEVLEGLISRVQGLVYRADPDLPSLQQAFHSLEAADIYLEQEQEDINTGSTEEQRIQLLHLLCAAWVTVCRRLQAADALGDIVNWKYVLCRAVDRLDAMAGDEPVNQALDVLQAIVEGDEYDLPEDGQQGVGIAAQFDLADQLKLYLQALGRTELKEGHKAIQPSGHRPATLAVQPYNTGADGEDDDDGANEVDGVLAGVQQLGVRQAGRLVALDDVALRPVLLRVCTRLPAEHPLRKEAEQDVGAQVGTEGWQDAVQDATAAAKAAGHVLPPPSVTIPEPDPTPSGMMDSAGLGGLQSMPNLLIPGFGDEGGAAGSSSFGMGEPTPSVAIFSPPARLSTCDSQLALFGKRANGNGALLDEDDGDTSQGLDADLDPALDLQPPAAADKGQRSMGASFASLTSTTMNSLPSELNLNMMPVSTGSLSVGVGNASTMASLAQFLGEDAGAGAADDLSLGATARVEFSNVDAGDALLGPSSGSMGLLDSRLGASSPGVTAWGSDLAPAGAGTSVPPARSPLGEGGYEDQLGEGPGSGFDDAWIGMGMDDGGVSVLNVGALGDVASIGVTTGKRPLAALQVPVREAKRVR